MKRINEETYQKIRTLIANLEGVENKVPHSFKTVFNFPGRKSIDIAHNIIETLAGPNDVLYDPFMGSGSFIIAASMANKKIIGNEIDNYTFSIVKTIFKKINLEILQNYLNQLETDTKPLIMNLYETECCGEKNYISKLFYDPQTEEYFNPTDNRDIQDGKNVKLVERCSKCHNLYKHFSSYDLEKLNEINNEHIEDFPNDKYIENSRINITAATGADYYNRLFTKRNQKALLILQNGIKNLTNSPEKDFLEFMLVSSLALSRIAMYGSSTDRLYHVVMKGAQETNVWEIFKNKVEALIKFQEEFCEILSTNPENNNLYELYNVPYQAYINNCLEQKFDMIYTDFPYTDQVPYLEWNQLYRKWLNKFYKPGEFELTEDMLNNELVLTNAPSRPNKQSLDNYFNDIDTMFKNFIKVLKDNKLAIFTIKLGARKYFETLTQIINLARKNGFEYIARIGIDKNDPTIRKQSAYKNTLSKEMIVFFEKLPKIEAYWYVGNKNYEFEVVKLIYNKILQTANSDITLTTCVQYILDILKEKQSYIATESDIEKITSVIQQNFHIDTNAIVRINCNKLYLDIEDNNDLFTKLYDLMPLFIKELLEKNGQFVLDDLYFEIANKLCDGNPNSINSFLDDNNCQNEIKKIIENYCDCNENVYIKKTYTNAISDDAIDVSCLSGTDFEIIIKSLLEAQGYIDVINTGGSGDLGVDLLAKKITNGNTTKYLFQCKRWVANVGSEPIQRLHSEKIRRGFDIAVCITTSDYTQDGKTIACANDIKIINGQEIVQQLNDAFSNKYYNGILES